MEYKYKQYLLLCAVALHTSVALANTNTTESKSPLVTTVTAKPQQTGIVVSADSTPSAGAAIKKVEPKTPPLNTLEFNGPKSIITHNEEVLPSFLKLTTTKSQRLEVRPDGVIRFLVKKGSLVGNAEALLKHCEHVTLYYEDSFPAALRMPNDFYLEGYDVLEILDQLIDPFVLSENVIAFTNINNIVRLSIGSNNQ